jgi:hypothetical protein
MSISRAQIPQQIKGFQPGGIVEEDLFEDYTTGTGLQPLDMEQFKVDDEQIEQLRKALQRPQFQLPGPPTPERVQQYSNLLTNIAGQPSQPNLFDVASQVGASMLAADPTEGAFRSLGRGLAEAGLSERKRRAAFEQQRSAIAAKAFELAKSDEDAAARILNEYDLALNKSINNPKYKEYLVTAPQGIRVRDQLVVAGDKVFLNPQELRANLNNVEEVPESQEFSEITETGVAVYRSPQDAEAFLATYAPGFKEKYPQRYEKALEAISTDDPKLIGKTILSGQMKSTIKPMYDSNNEVIDVIVSAQKDYSDPTIVNFRKETEEALVKEQANLRTIRASIMPSLRTALSLLLEGKAETGPFVGQMAQLRAVARNAFGLNLDAYSDLEVIISIANQLAPQMRVAGSGSTSDMEFEAMLKALISADKTPEANYIAAYMLLRRYEIQEQQLKVLTEKLYDETIRNPIEILEAVNAVDTGLYEKYDGDPNDAEAIQIFYDSLPNGAIIENNPFKPIFLDDNGNPITDVFIIKGGRFPRSL